MEYWASFKSWCYAPQHRTFATIPAKPTRSRQTGSYQKPNRLPPTDDHNGVLPKPARQPPHHANIRNCQEVEFRPVSAISSGWQHRIPLQHLGQPCLHPHIPAWRHEPGKRIIRGDENSLFRASGRQQPVHRQ